MRSPRRISMRKTCMPPSLRRRLGLVFARALVSGEIPDERGPRSYPMVPMRVSRMFPVVELAAPVTSEDAGHGHGEDIHRSAPGMPGRVRGQQEQWPRAIAVWTRLQAAILGLLDGDPFQ